MPVEQTRRWATEAEVDELRRLLSRMRGGAGTPGPAGPPGADGVGSPGPPGADGRTLLNGTGAPGGGLGADGDFYIDTAVPAIYGPKTAGAWGSPTSLVGPTGAAGAAGVDGKTVRNGSGAPAGGLGVDGDFYIDTATWGIYGPKAAGAWGSPTSLVGATGATGAAGPGLATGGATGTLATKASGTDYDTTWVARAGIDPGAIQKELYDANTILTADTDDTPGPLTVAAQRLVGRITGGVIDDLTPTQALSVIASGTPDGSKYVRDDNTLAVPPFPFSVGRVKNPSTGTVYNALPGVSVTSQGTKVLTANHVYYVPILVLTTTTFDQCGFGVTSGPASNANVRVGAFVADVDWAATGSPLFDSGDVAVTASATGVFTASISWVAPPGRYLLSIEPSVTMTCRAMSGAPALGAYALAGTSLCIQEMDYNRGSYGAPVAGSWTVNLSTSGSFQYPVGLRVSVP